MKVAIIDSGINPKYLHLCDGGYGLCNERLQKNENLYDTGLHGTLCAATMKSIENDLKIYHIKIVNENGVASGKMLLQALKWLESSEIKIINISLATRKNILCKEMEIACKKLDDEGKIIFASSWNHSLEEVFPAALSGVIGVQGTQNRNDLIWTQGRYEICVNSEAELIDLNTKTMTFFMGTSKATAMASALCAKCLHQKGDMNRNQFIEWIKKEKLKYDYHNYDCKKKIDTVKMYREISRQLNVGDKELKKLCSKKYKNNPQKCIQLVEKLKEVYPSHKRIFLKDFESEISIINMINERWSKE